MSSQPPEIRYYDPAAQSASAAIRRLAEFQHHLYELTPRVIVTPCLIAGNIAILLLMAVFRVNVLMPGAADLLPWGADFGPKTLSGEWWRLFTSMFLHFGVVHLGFNMWVLYVAGPLVERMLGNTGFLLMYLISGLLGGLATLAWSPMAVSAGASGAIFGIYGCLLGLVLRGRRSIPPDLLVQLRSSGLGFLFYNLIFGMMIPNIGLAAHLGGLAGGFLCGLVLAQPLTPAARWGRVWRNLLLVALAAPLLGGGAWGVAAWQSGIESEMEKLPALEKTASDAFERMDKQEISARECARILEEEVLPPWQDARTRLAKAKPVSPEKLRLATLLLEYMRLREEAWRLYAEGAREDNAEKIRLAKEVVEQINRETEDKSARTKNAKKVRP